MGLDVGREDDEPREQGDCSDRRECECKPNQSAPTLGRDPEYSHERADEGHKEGHEHEHAPRKETGARVAVDRWTPGSSG